LLTCAPASADAAKLKAAMASRTFGRVDAAEERWLALAERAEELASNR